MKLNKIKLKNIRSYLQQEINFPDGSILLSGDIGSGKSTILLAIDFVLFGLRRGAGASLLRNGEKEGDVELHFEIDNKEVIIKRSLKKGKVIGQDTGYIIINGEKKEGTATELKQIILDLFGYPKELLTRDTLIYRYTVYTPQEEMKNILISDKDYRLDTLRKVFGIDKYKRIKENANIFNTYLKEKRKELEIRISDLEEKKKLLEEKKNELNDNNVKLKIVLNNFNELNKEIEKSKKEIKKTEEQIKRLNEVKKNLELNNLNLEHKSKNIENIKKRITELKIEEIKAVEEVNEKEIKLVENNIKEISSNCNNFKIKINNSEEIINKIIDLDKCPTCEQEVREEYKNNIVNREKKNIENFKKLLRENEVILLTEEENLKKLRNRLKEYEFFKIKKEELDTKRKLKEELEKEYDELKNDIKNINTRKIELETEFTGIKNIEENYENLKEKFESLVREHRKVEIEKVGLEKEENIIKKEIDKLNQEIKEKIQINNELTYWNQIYDWLQKYFLNLMDIMERKIMFRVHSDFDSLFQKWFDMLVSDELLKIKLDEEFTPVIEQNGHEINYEFLSGGEKTAAALAYRLALNQVINSLIGLIKTRDLLILDEPTDGFSTEQLDKVKMVLDELKTRQVIIVSHEAKVESFVDNVIKIEKRNHVSNII